MIEFRSWYIDLVTLLRHHSVFFVGVHCEINELERRERLRGDRKVGEGRLHLEDGVHTWGRYDIEVDTSRLSRDGARDRVVDGFRPMIPRAAHSGRNGSTWSGEDRLLRAAAIGLDTFRPIGR